MKGKAERGGGRKRDRYGEEEMLNEGEGTEGRGKEKGQIW